MTNLEMDTDTDPASHCTPSGEVYQYTSVNSEDNEIRVVHIQPGSKCDPLFCQLSNVSLNKNPIYSALSYTWVTEKACVSIIIDGKTVSITLNLESALRRLRSTDEVLTLWVDSICINQEDLVERSAQASRMKLIYQQAASVSVWLGGEGEEGDIAWSLLEDLDNASDTTLNAIVGDSSRFNQFQALKKIFRRRYWFRIWVAQEVTVGKSVTVYCGRHSISWGRLNEICEDLKHLKEYLIWSLYPNDPTSVFSLLSGGPKSLGLTKWSVKTQSEIQPPLLELLYAHMSKHSSDPRDKVYALVGISNSQVSFGPIDYERSLVETFTHTARHLISTTRSLDVICACQNEDVMHDLPSWAPDWERRSKYPMHRVMGLHIRRPQYETAGKDSEAIVSFSEDSRVLTARGFALDTIKEVSSTFWIDGHHKDEHKIVQTLHTFKEWWTLYSNFKGTEASLEEFNHTFCGGSWAAVYDVHDKKRLELFCALFKTLLPEHDFEHAPFPGTTAESDEDQRSTVSTASLRMHNRRLALSANEGLACLAPPTAQPGDVACILLGCNFPVLLHKVEDGYYTLVGEIYVDGKMNGEAMK